MPAPIIITTTQAELRLVGSALRIGDQAAGQQLSRRARGLGTSHHCCIKNGDARRQARGSLGRAGNIERRDLL
jgi:hypothetical protein